MGSPPLVVSSSSDGAPPVAASAIPTTAKVLHGGWGQLSGSQRVESRKGG